MFSFILLMVLHWHCHWFRFRRSKFSFFQEETITDSAPILSQSDVRVCANESIVNSSSVWVVAVCKCIFPFFVSFFIFSVLQFHVLDMHSAGCRRTHAHRNTHTYSMLHHPNFRYFSATVEYVYKSIRSMGNRRAMETEREKREKPEEKVIVWFLFSIFFYIPLRRPSPISVSIRITFGSFFRSRTQFVWPKPKSSRNDLHIY